MSLVEHAKRELELAGLFDEDSDYGGMIGETVMELVEVFSKQGHSGGSAFTVIPILERLLKQQNLTPITSNPSEWIDRTKESGYILFQNNRNSELFSEDGGKTYYNVNEPDKILTSLITNK